MTKSIVQLSLSNLYPSILNRDIFRDFGLNSANFTSYRKSLIITVNFFLSLPDAHFLKIKSKFLDATLNVKLIPKLYG